MTKKEVIAQCRANPDKIFHILKRDGFAGAKVVFDTDLIRTGEWYIDDLHPEIRDRKNLPAYMYHMQQLALAPDELAYLEEVGEII